MRNKRSKNPSNKGFSLIELMLVISIIGFLASIILVGMTNARRASRDAKRKADALQLRKALEIYSENNSGLYPNGGGLPAQNTAYNASLLAPFLVPAVASGVPADPGSPGVYQYAWTNSGKDYVLIIPFTNDATIATCKFTSPGGAALFGGVPLCTYQN